MLSHSILEPGAHGIRWDGRDQSGADLPSGVYLIRILAGGGHDDRVAGDAQVKSWGF